MATLPSGDTRPEGFSLVRRDAGELVSALERGIIPWLRQDWLESAGALPPNFAPSGPCDVEEGFHELFAATGMDSCHGASITFYSQFDDMTKEVDRQRRRARRGAPDRTQSQQSGQTELWGVLAVPAPQAGAGSTCLLTSDVISWRHEQR
jgi:hypothetical protein